MSRGQVRAIVMSVIALGAAANPAGAQDAVDRMIGKPISAVQLQVEGRPETSPALVALIDIAPGDRLTLEAMRRVAARLSQVPRFDSVRVLAEEQPAGIVLTFALEPTHPIDRLEISGDTGIPAEDLNRSLREQFNGLPTLTRLTEVDDTIQRLLRSEGYRAATVDLNVLQTHDPHRSTLSVAVIAGKRTTITSASVRGESPLTPDRVIARLEATPGNPFRERALAAGLAAIRDELRGQGYYTAIAQHQPALTADQSAVALTLTIDAGPLVELRVTGELPGKVDDLIPIKQAGSVDVDLLDDARAAVESTLRRRGYWRARVSYVQERPSPDRLLITYTVDQGKRYRIARVEIPAGLQVTAAEIQALKALKPGEWFSQEGVQNALLTIKAQYQQKGFHQIVMDPKFNDVAGKSADEGGVVVVPNITEGPRAVVSRIVFALGQDPGVGEADLRSHMNAREKAPYVPANLVYDTRGLEAYYESLGYLNRLVELSAEFTPSGTEAVIAVFAREGPQILVGEITVVGNERLSREEILREITLRPGLPYSESARVESQRRLYNLSSFRSVRISAQPRLPGESVTRLVISVEEADSKTLGYGGGLEAGSYPRSVEGDRLEDKVAVSPRAFIELGRRNLGGRNRAVNFFARVTAKPKNAPGDPTQDGKGFGFAEYRVSATYNERFAFNSNSDLVIGATSEQAVRTSFNFTRRLATAELLRPLTQRVTLSSRYSLEVTELFDERIPENEQPLIDRLFPQVRLSILSGTVIWDQRTDTVGRFRGGQFIGGLDLAPRALGSEVGFVKSFFQASIARPFVPNRLTFAGRAQLGLANGINREVPRLDASGDPVLINGQPVVDVVSDLPASQRFFAGGSVTVRGFQQDRLGVEEILDAQGLSNGGNGLVVLNGEMRLGLLRLWKRQLGVVGFVDAGNVFKRAGDISLSRLRATLGFGVRYDSPLGPLRLDFGFKTDRMVFARATESRWEFHFSIGEVF